MGTTFIPGGPPRYDHQKRGLNKLISTGGVCALLFDPGTGKTATTLDYLSLLALKSPDREARVLVVSPLAAVDTWVLQADIWLPDGVNYWCEALGGSIRDRGEALASRGGSPFKLAKGRRPGQHAPRALHHGKSLAWTAKAAGRIRPITPTEGPDGLGVDLPKLIIEVINLDTLASRQRLGSGTMADFMLEAIKRYDPHVVVVDESHKIKGAQSNTSRLMARIGQNVPRRIALTGTVMPAGPLDVFGQWRFLDPYAFGQKQPDGTVARMTFENFKNRFAVLGGYMGREVTGYKNLDEMQLIMGQRASVARKEDALDLPATTPVIVPVNLTPAETAAYADMKKNLMAQMSNGITATTTNRLSQLMRLRQITSGHLPDDLGITHELGDSKVRTITSIVNDQLAGESRVVVFSMFTHEIHAIVDRLRGQKGQEVMLIEGETPSQERLALRQRFGSDERTRMIMVAQVKTLSLAVNELVTASNAVFGSLSQQRDDLIQAQDRLNRIGQTKPVTFWFALAPKTVDEVIYKSHQDKTNLESAMLKHIFEGEL